MEIDIRELIDVLGVDHRELEIFLGDMIEEQLRIVMRDASEERMVINLALKFGDDYLIQAARQAVEYWVRSLG